MEAKLRKIFGDKFIDNSKIAEPGWLDQLNDDGYSIESIMASLHQIDKEALINIGFKKGQLPQLQSFSDMIDVATVDSWSPTLDQNEINYIKKLFKLGNTFLKPQTQNAAQPQLACYGTFQKQLKQEMEQLKHTNNQLVKALSKLHISSNTPSSSSQSTSGSATDVSTFEPSKVSASHVNFHLFCEIAAKNEFYVDVNFRFSCQDELICINNISSFNLASQEETKGWINMHPAAYITKKQRPHFHWYASEAKCTPKALQFLKTKLDVSSSSIRFNSVVSNSKQQFNILASCQLDALAWLSDRNGLDGESRVKESILLGIEFFKPGQRKTKSESGQPLIEIANIACTSKHPVMLLLTDLQEAFTVVVFGATNDTLQINILQNLKSTIAYGLVSKWLNGQYLESEFQQAAQILKSRHRIANATNFIEEQSNQLYITKQEELGLIPEEFEQAYEEKKTLIGKGRNGDVYLIEVKRDGWVDKVALKVCNFRCREVVEELQNEILKYKHLSKFENCAKYYQSGCFSSRELMGLATEYLEEYSHVREGLSLALQRKCIQALKSLHQLKFAHGDIRAENIMVRESDEPQVKLIDFGFTHQTEDKHYFNQELIKLMKLLGLAHDQSILADIVPLRNANMNEEELDLSTESDDGIKKTPMMTSSPHFR